MNDAISNLNLSRANVPDMATRRAATSAMPVAGNAILADRILRFQRSERWLHWSIAAPFMVCFATGFVLMGFYNLHSEGASRAVLSWMHRISGACFIVSPTLSVIVHWRDFRIHRHNAKEALRWSIDDVRWMGLMGLRIFNAKIILPEQGKFNAAEKLNFLMVMCTYPLFIATGLSLWLPGVRFLSWIGHVAMAILAAPLVLGHVYMALVNPDTRAGLGGMLSGYVDRRWAKHHYGRWYREHFVEPKERAPKRPATIV
jgi:formate dehydrogenase subunit gamma